MSRLSSLLFPQSPLPILIVDSESLLISEANPAAGRLFARELVSFQDAPLKSLCAFGEFARLQHLLERGKGPHSIALKLHRGKDEIFHAELRAALLDSGGENEWVFFCRDITSEKEAAEALKRSEREYRRMVENSPDGIALIQEGIVVFANMAAEKLLGVSSPDELWAAEFDSFVHPDDLPLWKEREQKVLNSDVELPLCELRLLRPDGKFREAELAQYVIERPEGRAMQITLRDISARKKLEVQIKESEERYKGLAEVAFDGVAVHFEGVLLTANRSFDSIFGYAEGDTRGCNIYELIAEEQRDYFKKEIDSGEVLELEGLRQDGRRVSIEASTRACTYLGDPAYVTAVRDISVRKNAEEAIRHQAYYDALTGLPNRLLFMDRLSVAVEQAARIGAKLAVMFLDLDRFKLVNDSLGHNIGDLLLFEAAGRISACLSQGDTVSRLGGDEFTVLCSVTDEKKLLALADTIVKSLAEPFMLQDEPIQVGVSVGIALYPGHADNADELVKKADAAMYQAKELGRNQYVLWTPGADLGNRHRLGQEARLRQALDQREFVVYYQPKIDLSTGRLKGAEALVRWQHPERGLVMPDEFIPLAEESRLILRLGEQVLEEATRQSRAWDAAGHHPMVISVNLSGWQLQQTDLAERVMNVLKNAGAEAGRFELEITETVAMRNPGQTLSTLRELAARGLQLSLDDFGKGYSSLNYLKQFPVHVIKVDMSFIRDILTEPKDAAIVRAMVLLAHNLNMKILCEGVETKEQAAYLKSEGCDLAQGYYYARPLPPAEFEKLLAKESVKA